MTTILIAILTLVILAALFGFGLGWAAIRFKVEGNPVVEQIDAELPQTQCGQCGYPGCKPYAEAVANGEEVNLCVPGGTATVAKLADIMGVEAKPIAAQAADADVKMVARIIEEDCIGCTKCIQACPVDAIAGATRAMHTVIVDACTGCKLCVSPCPTDCIVMEPVHVAWKWQLDSIPVVNIK